ncbi:PSD1 and planctomycete cytochrome C domain-containing protein [Neorhodopirellula pilleata]|nr:PSD1 and planctomycete cytochrome C domain-containing protein [Neorhodopirellula pilleata]
MTDSDLRTICGRLASLWLIAAVIAVWGGNANAEDLSSAAYYVDHIKPLLAEKCVSCHGPLQQSSGLRLDAGQLIHEFAEASELIVPRKVDASELIVRVMHPDEEQRMPPPGEGTALDVDEVERLRHWIESGAKYPGDETYLDSPEQHWAFQPLTRPMVPQFHLESTSATDAIESRSTNPIDAFLQSKRVERGVRTFGPADSTTMRRRLSFDLTGVPDTTRSAIDFQPSGEEGSKRPMISRDFIRVVDRMLASPEHAERWARHWMDVWRYSDWDGYKEELRGSQRHIWHWRDWIVDSLMDDKPYDQMVVEMLAADESDPLSRDALRATGFLARNFHKSNRNIWLDSTVEHTAKAFLGLTLACAKCHDHKYDPIAQEEYYQFRAIFEPHQTRTDHVEGEVDTKQDGIPRAYDSDLSAKTPFLIAGDEKRPDESRTIEPKTPSILGVDYQISPVDLPPLAYAPHLQKHVRQLLVSAQERKLAETEATFNKNPNDPIAKLALAAQRASMDSLMARYEADEARFLPNQTEEDTRRLAMRASALQNEHRLAEADLNVARKRKALETAESSRDSSDNDDAKKQQKQIEDAKQKLSQAESERDKVSAAVSSHGESPNVSYDSIAKTYPKTSSGRRLALARWITSPSNPLAARVAVNHIWMRHFGKPLVAQVDDFGLRSPEPLHRELLDWLAVEFIEGGWRMKPLHRLIVTSQAYALASSGDAESTATNLERDPDNMTYWRFDPIRLEAEAIRDNLIAVAGQLDRRLGGPDIDHARGEDVMRRSLYFRHAYEKQMTMLTTFDAASPNECYRRDTSVIPQQALVLANSKLARQMSETLAEQLHQGVIRCCQDEHCRHVPDKTADERFVKAAFQRVLGRLPSPQEQRLCCEFLTRPSGQSGTSDVSVALPQQARASLVHVLINHNDFVTIR